MLISRRKFIEKTEDMWRNRWVKSVVHQYRLKHPDATLEEIKENLLPEWICLIDRWGTLRNCKYYVTAWFFARPPRAPPIKPFSIGTAHYHPIEEYKPSAEDIMGWTNRYLQSQEFLYIIHTDEKTLIYDFRGLSEEDISPTIKAIISSIGLAIFGIPEKARKLLEEWFKHMVATGKIKQHTLYNEEEIEIPT